MYLTEEEKENYKLIFHFNHKLGNPCYLDSTEGDSRIWFMNKEEHERLLNAYHEFKAQNPQE